MTRYIRFLVVPCIALLSVLGTLLPGILRANLQAHAATASVDPLVVIAVDATNQGGPCSETFIANLHTPHQSITHISCPAGTIIRSITIPRSQAEAQHEAYIVLPPPRASRVVWWQVYRQIQQLMEAKGHTLLQSLKQKSVHPLTACGSSGSASLYWNPLGDTNYYSTEQFFKTSDCKHVDLEVASINVHLVYPYDYTSWVYDLYAGGKFGVPGCPTLAGGTYSHSVDQLWPPGYYYENWVYEYSCGYGNSWYNNIGPIN